MKPTQREAEILGKLSAGYTTKEIAHQLYISPHTVITHKKNLIHKMQVGNTVQLIVKAVRMGMVCVMMLLPSISYGQLDSLGCTGAVGDIKYSILAPDDFQAVNGDCWVLSDGRNISSSKLGALGIEEAPDYRGLFIRSYDNRQTNREDPERLFGDPVGEFQEDAFKSHQHTQRPGTGSRWFDVYQFSGGTWPNEKHGNTTTNTGLTGNEHETRPKNRTAYTYLRIN